MPNVIVAQQCACRDHHEVNARRPSALCPHIVLLVRIARCARLIRPTTSVTTSVHCSLFRGFRGVRAVCEDPVWLLSQCSMFKSPAAVGLSPVCFNPATLSRTMYAVRLRFLASRLSRGLQRTRQGPLKLLLRFLSCLRLAELAESQLTARFNFVSGLNQLAQDVNFAPHSGRQQQVAELGGCRSELCALLRVRPMAGREEESTELRRLSMEALCRMISP